jgi:hypothetical protein
VAMRDVGGAEWLTAGVAHGSWMEHGAAFVPVHGGRLSLCHVEIASLGQRQEDRLQCAPGLCGGVLIAGRVRLVELFGRSVFRW